MKQPKSHRALAPAHPLWMRWIAAVALLMAGVMGTADAAHIHGDWLPNNRHELHASADNGGLPGGEEHCPICVAMHSALPASLVLSPVLAVVSTPKLVEREVIAPASQWHFAMFSRPPPASFFV